MFSLFIFKNGLYGIFRSINTDSLVLKNSMKIIENMIMKRSRNPHLLDIYDHKTTPVKGFYTHRIKGRDEHRQHMSKVISHLHNGFL